MALVAFGLGCNVPDLLAPPTTGPAVTYAQRICGGLRRPWIRCGLCC